MSVLLTKIPTHNPVRNPIGCRYAVSGGGPIQTEAVYPEWYLEPVNSTAPSGQTITLNFGEVEVIFARAATPDPLLGQYGGASREELRDSLMEAMQANYYMGTYFDITPVDASPVFQIHVKAFDASTLYALTDSVITDNNTPQIWLFTAVSFAGSNEVSRANYGINTQLWVEDVFMSGSFDLKLKEVLPVNSEMKAVSDISTAVRAYVEPTMPDPDMNLPVRMVDMFKRFKVRYAEQWGAPVDVKNMETDGPNVAYLAGRSEVARALQSYYNQIRDADSKWRFFTNWPNTDALKAKRVQADQREFLATILLTAHTRIAVVATIWYTDYTVLEEATLRYYDGHDGDPVLANELVLFPCGIDQTAMADILPLKTIEKYCVWITDQNGVQKSEKRYFTVDREHHENFRQFHYLNTAGGIDTLVFHGPRREELRADMQRSNRYTPTNPSAITDLRTNADVLESMDTVYELGTEYLHQDELYAMRDLLSSERIVERVNGEHWPVQLVDSKLKAADEREDRTALPWKYRYALKNTANTLNA